MPADEATLQEAWGYVMMAWRVRRSVPEYWAALSAAIRVVDNHRDAGLIPSPRRRRAVARRSPTALGTARNGGA
jgi:hypothetical protein